MPGPVMRAMGLLGDLAQRLGRDAQLTSEAAGVLTRSVPIDDRVARALLPGPARSAEASFRDLLEWLGRAGHLAFSPEACDSRDRRRS